MAVIDMVASEPLKHADMTKNSGGIAAWRRGEGQTLGQRLSKVLRSFENGLKGRKIAYWGVAPLIYEISPNI